MRDQQKSKQQLIDELKSLRQEIEMPQKVETKYRFLLDSTVTGVVILDRDWRYLALNDAMASMLQTPKDKLIGKKMTDLFPDVEQSVFGKAFQQVFETGEMATATDSFTFPDGHEQWYQDNVYPVQEGLLIMAADITDRKRAEEELLNSKEFNARLIDTAQVIVLTLDEDALITTFNQYAENLTGYNKNEVLGQNWFETFIPERDREEIPRVFKDVLKQMPAASTHENPIRCKDGSEKLVAWSNTILSTQSREMQGILSIGRDITERKESEEIIRQQATYVNENPAPVFSTAINGKIIGANPATEKIFNRSIIGEAVQAVIPGIKTSIINGLVVDEPIQVEEEINNGTYIFTLLKKGSPNSIYIYGSDISKRKQVEQALQNGEERYRTLVESTRDGVVITDSEGNFIFVNSSYATMLGYSSPDELIGTSAIDRYANPEERAGIFKQLSKNGYADNLELELIKKDGTTIFVLFSVIVKKDETGKIVQTEAFVSDITERKQAAQELAKHRDHLEEQVEERTGELKKTINLMAGREIRIAGLKKSVKTLRSQLESAGIKPAADDPLIK